MRGLTQRTFAPAQPMPGVVPEHKVKFAQDEAVAVSNYSSWAANNYYNSAVAEGTVFLGYSYLAALSQRAEYRVVSETIASEATRQWIKLKSASDDPNKMDLINAIVNELDALDVEDVFRVAMEHDGMFGRGHIYLDTGDTDDLEELQTPLGNGRNELTRNKVSKDKPLKAIRTVEPVWTFPTDYNTRDPLKDNWYRPEMWYVMGKKIHHTRFLTLVGRPVADVLKPAYAFGGLSMSQMLKPYVENWLRTRQSVSDTLHSFAVSVIKTNLETANSPGAEDLYKRIDLFTNLRDNRGVMIIDKDAEDFLTVQTALGGLDQLQAQAQEQMAAIARIPIVKLLGIDPHGLNASSEGSLRTFYDWIEAFRRRLFIKPLKTIIGLIQLSLFGKVDPDITVDFESLWQLDETAQAGLELTKAQTHQIYADTIGAVDADEVRSAIREDKDSPYAGLELEGEAPGPPGGMGEEAPDPLTPDDEEDASDDAVDPDRISTWRRRAAALFNDEDDIGYWARRANELFGGREKGRWAALAAKLAITSNEDDTIDTWERRAKRWREREIFSRESIDDPPVFAAPLFIDGANVVDIAPTSRAEGSATVRWDTPDSTGRSAYAGSVRTEQGPYRRAAARLERNVMASDKEVDWDEKKPSRGNTKNDGQFSKSGSSGKRQTKKTKKFVPPNIKEGLDFRKAEQGLTGRRQQALRTVSRHIDESLGLRHISTANVIGACVDGAENSVMSMHDRANPTVERAAAAMKGYLAEQKAILLFRPADDGFEAMASFKLSGELKDIHENLKKSGLEFNTLEPVSGGARVYVYAPDQETLDLVAKASDNLGGSEQKVLLGKGEFIGTKLETGSDDEQRDDAKRVYQSVIEEAQNSDRMGNRVRAIWTNAQHHWRDAFQEAP
jgi:phage-related protein (TIGR01555 family)